MGRDTILLNTSNYKGNNTYSLRFPQPVQFKEGSTLSLKTFSMYNSFFNISASQYGNSAISFQWIDGTFYNWNISDGYYSLSDLNLWLQSMFVENNLYYTTKSSQTVYSAQFLTNAVQYKNEIDIFYVPSASQAAAAGLVIPSSATWTFPQTPKLPVLTINQGLLNYFGMSSRLTFGNETDQTRNYQYLSDTLPIISPVYNLLITCNLCHTYFSNSPLLLDQFPISSAYGNLINYTSTFDSRLNINNAIHNELTIQLWDQNFRPLIFKDYELTLSLLIETV